LPYNDLQQQKFSSSKIDLPTKRCAWDSLTVSSNFQVESPDRASHNTFTILMALPLSCLIFWSSIMTGWVSSLNCPCSALHPFLGHNYDQTHTSLTETHEIHCVGWLTERLKQSHIQLRHNLAKQLLKKGTIFIDYVKSKWNLADPLTKPLGRNMILETSRGMRLKPLVNKQVMKTQPLWLEIPWIRFIWVKTSHLLVLLAQNWFKINLSIPMVYEGARYCIIEKVNFVVKIHVEYEF